MDSGVEVLPTERSWDKLRDDLEMDHTKPNSPIRAIETIEGWVEEMGACLPFLDIAAFVARITTLASGLAFEVPSPERIVELLDHAYRRWECCLKRVHVPVPG
jgi:hypothetical protein